MPRFPQEIAGLIKGVGMMEVNNPLIRPYFFGGLVLGGLGPLDSHDIWFEDNRWIVFKGVEDVFWIWDLTLSLTYKRKETKKTLMDFFW